MNKNTKTYYVSRKNLSAVFIQWTRDYKENQRVPPDSLWENEEALANWQANEFLDILESQIPNQTVA